MSTDVIAVMMDAVRAGRYCRLCYDKQDGTPLSTRIVEPRQLVDGLSGLMIRCFQIEPERGVRTFRLERVADVQVDSRILSELAQKRNTFCTGEVIGLKRDDAEVWREPRAEAGSVHRHRAAWTTPWFSTYVAFLRDALLDAQLSPAEAHGAAAIQFELGLTADQIASAHAYLLAEELMGFAADGVMSSEEQAVFASLSRALGRIGWSVGD